MAVFKCKMCGGNIEISADKTFGTCDSCGSTMTFPKLDDDQKADAYNRGNHFRRIGEFDKALQVYERIVSEDPSDAEAHWCCALCRFGIEYVEDPTTLEYVPTCHRASFDIFTEDVDYLAAVENADGITKRQYQKDGMKIAEVQRGILKTSQNEKPFDVFICYKETGENGSRTVDSTLAQDIYYQLTDAGMRVFFARITLEDKAGSEYEPYIFAALNSAKAMVAVGTKPEHFNAVWVKNEWSRYLSLVKHDRNRVLLPCYRDMDPYDLPEQLSVLQSYDMSKIGFMQDLIRGIRKIVDAGEKPVEKIVVNNAPAQASVAPLLERAFIFLEDGNFEEADQYCERVLDQDPKNAAAYVGKLMASLEVNKQEDLKDCEDPFDDDGNYQKAVRYADPKLADELKGYISFINDRNKQKIYDEAMEELRNAKTVNECHLAEKIFEEILGFKDSVERIEECKEKAKFCVYNSADEALKNAQTADECREAAKIFGTIPDFKDSAARVEECEEKAKLCIYDSAVEAMSKARWESDFRSAEQIFKKVQGYKDSDELAAKCFGRAEEERKEAIYRSAKRNMTKGPIGEYEKAIQSFQTILGYKDSEEQITICHKKLEEIKANQEAIRIASEKAQKRKKITTIIVVSVLLLSIVAAIVAINIYHASDKYIFGIIQNSDGMLTVGEYRGEENEVVIPETIGRKKVTRVHGSAFENCKDITSITIPGSVTSIGEKAFSGCSRLTSITIPDSVTSIGGDAFYECTRLTSITIPDSVTNIGDSAFRCCSGLTSITISNSVTSIGNYTFSGCNGLTSITIPNSVTSIGDGAFFECGGLTSITIPDSVTSIGDGAFFECGGLTSITIPDSVTSIGNYAFQGCSGLTSITLPFVGNSKDEPSDTSFKYIFGDVPKSLKTVILTGGTSIGNYAFSGCSGLTSITIPNSVTRIGDRAFYNCSGLTSITIGNSVTSIGDFAFYGCSELTSITIGNSVTSIGDAAFYGCSSLESITIPDGMTSIGNLAFAGCIKLTELTIPDSVTSIGECAINGCSALTSIALPFVGNTKDEPSDTSFKYLFGYVPESLKTVVLIGGTSIGDKAFSDCSGLTSITIPDSVTSIGNSAFSRCRGLTSITIPDGVTSIGDSAFYGCSGLTSITIPDGVTSIGDSAFYGCSGLTSITIPDGVTSIGNSEFRGCSGLTSITIPDGVTSIGNYAFNNCRGLTSITIPKSVTSIGDYAFNGCSKLTSITFNGTKVQWNAISKMSSWNSNTGKYVVHCTNGNISK